MTANSVRNLIMIILLVAFFLIAIVTSFLCSLWEAVLLSITPSYAQVQVEKGGEAVFVNIVGDIDLETISRLGGKFDIPGIYDLDEHGTYDKDKEDKSDN